MQQNWNATPLYPTPRCLTAKAQCEAILFDLDGDGQSEILLFPITSGLATAFKFGGNDKWILLGTLSNTECAGVRDALRVGKFAMAEPRLKDVDVNGQRLRVNIACAR